MWRTIAGVHKASLELNINKTENPFSLQDDEHKSIRSPNKTYETPRVALRNPKGNHPVEP